MSEFERVDPSRYKAIIQSMPAEQVQKRNQAEYERCVADYKRFKDSYNRDICLLCDKPFKSMSIKHPCVHWLLKRCKFKKRDFPSVFQNFDYFRIAGFLRWTANQERFQGNINDLSEESNTNKVFQYTIQWKNVEWTFECSYNDYSGHERKNSNFPHYHFQMRIDNQQFINFNDYHIPFSERDLFNLDLMQADPEYFRQSFGPGGAGMNEAMELGPEDIIKHSTRSKNEDKATYHIRTLISSPDNPISGEEIEELFEESRKTGKTFAHLAQERFQNKADVETIVSPIETIPDIAKRKEHKSR